MATFKGSRRLVPPPGSNRVKQSFEFVKSLRNHQTIPEKKYQNTFPVFNIINQLLRWDSLNYVRKCMVRFGNTGKLELGRMVQKSG